MAVTDGADRVLLRATIPNGTGVLVVSGSSGRLETQRAAVLATTGVTVLAARWFGGAGQPTTPTEIPLETFVAAIDQLRAECDRVVLVGASFGAEAALLTAAADDRVAAVAAFAPTPFVWPGFRDGSDREVSHWTWRGDALPWIGFDPAWTATTSPPAYEQLYRRSVHRATRIAPNRVLAATIPVEAITGEVLLVAGGDDQVWPSLPFARLISARRAASGLGTTLVTLPSAGHRTILPGEDPVSGGVTMARGGTPAADAALGALCWPHLQRLLDASL